MAIQYSIQKMVSDGTLSTIALGIQYLQRNDIYMRIAGEETPQSGAPSGYTWSFINNTTLKVLPVVPNGVEVVVYRRTDVDAMYNVYSQNAQFDEATIDENNQQLLYIAQEYLEQGIPGAGVDTLEYVRDDGYFTYYRLRRTDGSYSEEFAVPSASSSTKVLTRESLRRSYAEAGYTLVDGSFEAGGVLVNANDVLLQEGTGKAFSGPAGPVAAGTNPTSGGFVDVSGQLGTIPCLKNLRAMPNLLQSTVSFYEGFGYGGADYLFDPAISKSLHDGVTVYAPEAIAAWDGTLSGITTLLEWTGAGTGAFVRQSSTPDTISLVEVGAVISKVVSSSLVVNHVNNKLLGHRLLLSREILLTATLTPRNRFIGSNRLLNTVWFSGVADGVVFDKVNYGASLEYCTVKPVSWDSVSGATGSGIRLIRPSNVIDVSSERWPEHGCIMHHDMTGQTGPYYSDVRNLITDYNGKHGCIIGTGANAVIVTNHIGRWNGAPSYTATPDDIVLGNYDGLLVSSTGDGNPGGAYPVYDPEGVRVIGGDCSYNSRWGHNVVNARSSVIQPSYAELNKKSSQQAVGASTRACVIDFPMGTDADIAVSQTNGEVNPNSIRVKGKLIGSGYLGSDGYRLNMELKGLRNRMTTGSNCSIDFVPDSAGNLHVNGTGYQPKLIMDDSVELRLGTANTVSVAAGAASTHKIKMLVGGVTYYLLAST